MAGSALSFFSRWLTVVCPRVYSVNDISHVALALPPGVLNGVGFPISPGSHSATRNLNVPALPRVTDELTRIYHVVLAPSYVNNHSDGRSGCLSKTVVYGD